MILKSKPHTIEAFQFTGEGVKPPRWFVEKCENNLASVTLSAKGNYITLYDGDGNSQRASVGDWVCFNGEDVFRLTDAKIREGFIV